MSDVLKNEKTSFDLKNKTQVHQKGVGIKKYFRAKMVTGLFALVITCLGFGLLACQSEPNSPEADADYCSAFCHSPMGEYAEGHDESNQTLAYAHMQSPVWSAENFEISPEGFLSADGERLMGNREFCLQCHGNDNPGDGLDWDAIVESTNEWGGEEGINPHKAHEGNDECSSCHSAHQTSMMTCNECHGFKVPEGWDFPRIDFNNIG